MSGCILPYELSVHSFLATAMSFTMQSTAEYRQSAQVAKRPPTTLPPLRTIDNGCQQFAFSTFTTVASHHHTFIALTSVDASAEHVHQHKH